MHTDRNKRHQITKNHYQSSYTSYAWCGLEARTMAINTICPIDAMCRFALWLPPLQDYDPRVGFQKDSNAPQSPNDSNVGMLPVIVAIPYVIIQCFEPLKNVDDTDDYGGVSHYVVVHIPVESQFMVFVGPQEQSKHLNHRPILHIYRCFCLVQLQITHKGIMEL